MSVEQAPDARSLNESVAKDKEWMSNLGNIIDMVALETNKEKGRLGIRQ